MRKHCGIPKGHVGRSVKPSNTGIKKRRIYWPLLSYTRAQLNGILTQILSSTLWMYFFSFFLFAIFNKPKLTRMIPAVLKKKSLSSLLGFEMWVESDEAALPLEPLSASLVPNKLYSPSVLASCNRFNACPRFFCFFFSFFMESRHWKCFI